MKILLIDDEPLLVKTVLTHGEHQVDVALNGYEALQLVSGGQGTPYDLIILDLFMPQMDGWETLKRIRGNPKLKDIYIIMLTANCQEDALVRGLDKGADEYLVKPISPKRLLAHLRALERRLYGEPLQAASSLGSLTRRECMVLNLLVRGWSNLQIAEKLVISQVTVKNHLAKIYRKLNVTSRMQAAAIARKWHLEAPDFPIS